MTKRRSGKNGVKNRGGHPLDAPPDRSEGLVSAVYADFCRVLTGDAERLCTIRGSLLRRSKLVAGDKVLFDPDGEEHGSIVELLPRTTLLSRAPTDKSRSKKTLPPQLLAANVDILVTVSSIRQPPFRAGLVERFLVAASAGGMESLLCVTKLDLDQEGEFEDIAAQFREVGVDVVGLSLEDAGGLNEVKQRLKGKTGVMVGHSGVGKTSLLNRLVGGSMVVGEIHAPTGMGQHTTTTARLVKLVQGGYLIDSPGIREFGMTGMTPRNVADHFPGLEKFSADCGFRDCLHRNEPKCAIKKALEEEKLSEKIYEGYLRLLEEVSEP